MVVSKFLALSFSISGIVISLASASALAVDASCVGKPEGTSCTSDTGNYGHCSGGSCFASFAIDSELGAATVDVPGEANPALGDGDAYCQLDPTPEGASCTNPGGNAGLCQAKRCIESVGP